MVSPASQLLIKTDTKRIESQTKIAYYVQHYGKLFSESLISPENTREKFRFANGYNESEAYFDYLDYQYSYNSLGDAVKRGSFAQYCVQTGHLYECEHDHTKVFDPYVCGEKNLCVICGHRYTQKLALYAKTLFNTLSLRLPDLYLSSIVFTLPKQLWDVIDYTNFSEFNDVCLKTIKQYHKGVMPAGVSASHTWHSQYPIGEKYPHGHSFWLNYGYDKKAGKFRMIDNFYDARKLRRIYRKNLKAAFGVNVPAVNLWIEYVKLDPSDARKCQKAWHMLSYAFRMPQKDATEFCRGVKWDNKARQYKQVRDPITKLSQRQLEHLNYILNPPRNWRRVRWYGWLSDSVKAHYLGLLGLSLDDVTPKKDDDDAEKRIICPKCHRDCVPFYLDVHERSNLITLKDAIKQFGSVYYPWDPGGTSEDGPEDNEGSEPDMDPDYSKMSYEDIYDFERARNQAHDQDMEERWIRNPESMTPGRDPNE
jgi:hypothetical protein